MVNLRKIGAIATGALFVGATFGMAAAITVPTTFSKTMLADAGVAKAQLIVGANAPGKAADTASATVIKDATAAKLAVAVGGKVKVGYGTYKWDDSDTNLNWIVNTTGIIETVEASKLKTTNATVDGKILNVSKGTYGYLRIDGNADGDFKDTADYNIYSGVYIVDGTTGIIQFLYNFSTDVDTTYSVTGLGTSAAGYLSEGATFKIKGKRYTLTELTDDKTVKLAPTIRASLSGVTTDMVANAVTVEGTRKLAWKTVNTSASTEGTLYLIDGTEVQQTIALTDRGRIADASITADSFKGYKIWVNNASSHMQTVYVTVIDKNKETSVSDTKTDVFGYYKIFIDRDGTSPEFTAGGRGIYFVDAPISLKLDGTVDVAGTEYYVDWETDKTMKLKRSKSVSVASGTKMKSAYADYSGFLSDDITATITEVGTKAPSLDVKDEATADKKMNLVLMGGPVANTLTAELVTGKKSVKIDWYTSAGDIDVVADAYTTGKTAIIVAGKDRAATKAAADALAAAL
ncbi:MAG: S-layer protein [Candidatus Hydrothermarchaeota archaeon]|nr:S-layer protein [Candidatus Hydrothermarchaeota archaeon]